MTDKEREELLKCFKLVAKNQEEMAATMHEVTTELVDSISALEDEVEQIKKALLYLDSKSADDLK